MSIRFVTGKPGGGKTYTAVKDHLIGELTRGNRCIVTNLALDLPELAQYLHDEFGRTFDLRSRMRILTQDEVAQFWTHYAPGLTLTGRIGITMPNGKKIEHIDYAPRMEQGNVSVLYIIDEVHEYFNARHWQHTGDDALHYLSQHRHLGDDVVCITQSLQNVDKQFRSLAQDFSYIRNHGKESLPILGGFFKSFGGFSRSTYLEPFSGSQSACETRFYKLDDKLAKCYRTAGGVGIKGNAADVGQDQRKGFHPVWLIALLVLTGCGAWKGLRWGSHTLVSAASGGSSGVRVLENAPTVTNAAPVAVSSNAVAKWNPSAHLVSTAKAPESSAPAANLVYMTGFMKWGTNVTVFLSDGRKFTQKDAELQFVSGQMCIIAGEVFRPKPPGTTP